MADAPTRFYRNVISVEILSNSPWTDSQLSNLRTVHEEITEGGSSGLVTVTELNEEVPADRMAELLIAQGSEPAFLLGDDPDED